MFVTDFGRSTFVPALSHSQNLSTGATMTMGCIAAGRLGLRFPVIADSISSSRALLSATISPARILQTGLQDKSHQTQLRRHGRRLKTSGVTVKALNLPVDPWAPGAAIDSQSIASSLFAASLFPYLGFLYHLTKSKTAPPLTLFGFYFLLAFVGATIPAGIYAKVHYGTSLSNVDWLHGSAESLLTVTNLLIVFGLRKALRDAEKGAGKESKPEVRAEQEEQLPLSK